MSKQKTQIAKTGNSGSSKFNRSLDQEYKIAAIDKIQAIAEFDMSGNILSANQNFLDIVGYNLEEIQGQHHSIFVEDSYKNTKEYSNFWKNLREGSFSSGEYKRIDKNGREVWIQGFYSSILNSEKKPVKVIKYATNITEQKLRNLEYSAQITAINKSLAVTEFDMSGNILDANQNFLDIIGYTLKEIQGKSHSMFLDDDYANSREYREFWDGLRAGIFNSGQYKRIGKGSKEIWLQSSYNPIFDDNHHPYKIIKYSLDLTEEIKAKIEERKKSEDELIAINNQLEFQNQLKSSVEEIANIVRGELSIEVLCDNVLKKLSDLINIKIGAFYILENEVLNICASYAYTKRKNLSSSFGIGEGLVGQCAKEKKPIILTCVPNDYVKISSGLGEIAPTTIMVVPIEFENQILGVLEIGKLTEFSRSDQHILENSTQTIGIAINGAIGRMRLQELLQETRAQEEELRATNEEMQSQQEQMRAQQETLQESNMALAKKTQALKQIQNEIQEKNTRLEKQKEELVYQREVTEQKKREIEKAHKIVEQKAAELEKANKYKSEFLANMSHELRTPLNSLLILSESLANNIEGNLTNDQIEAAKIINSGGKDLLNLINDILDLSKVEAGKLDISIQNVSIKNVFQNLQRQFNPIAKHKSIEFYIENPYELDTIVQTDQARLEQILKNFLSNAFKFTENGSVTIKLYKPEELENNHIAIKVIDTGIGIEQDKQTLIFEAFHQADGSISRQHSGTGLGLSISRELARLLGCEIKLESKKGEGSIFSLYIPISSSINSELKKLESVNLFEEISFINDASAARSINNISSPFLANNKDLLIIEDDEILQKIFTNFAQDRGYKTIHTKNTDEAIKLACEIKPTAIALDVDLADIRGLELLQDLKSNPLTSSIPVYIISEKDDLSKYYQYGAIGVSRKPLDLKKISKAFDKIDAINSGKIREVLMIEDDLSAQQIISGLIDDPMIKITQAMSAQEGLNALQTKNQFDIIILDLGLPDMSGLNFLQKLHKLSSCEIPPVIVYTGRNLDEKEFMDLRQFTPSFIMKGANSDERLLDELSLFLHLNLRKRLNKKSNSVLSPDDKYREILKDKKILIVDDDLRNTFALSGILKQRGLEVFMADNGKLALELLETTPSIDLIFMDIMMPIMDGYEATTKIRQKSSYNHIPIVTLSAKTLEEDREKALKCGANDFLTKPVEIDDLMEVAVKWLSIWSK